MSTDETIAVIGSGPAGLAAALALRAVGKPVKIYERYASPKPAGNILNLWPPSIKALECLGVDVDDIGAPCESTFRNHRDRLRADVHISEDVVRAYGGGFIGLLRPDLFTRMLAALPDETLVGEHEVASFEDHGDHVEVRFIDGTSVRTPLLVGADGINSTVRRKLLGEAPMREHNLHVIGGYTFDVPDGVDTRKAIIRHSRTVQGSYTGVRSDGRDGAEWWFVEAMDPAAPAPTSLHEHSIELAKEFPADLQQLVARTDPAHVIRWPIRDRGVPPREWARGRVVLAGDAVHATSPYAAYGAGMSIVDGYFLGQVLATTDLSDTAAVEAALQTYQAHRVDHCSDQVAQAYMLGRTFHHTPAILRPIRDFMLDRTPFLQKQVGDKNPAEINAQLGLMGRDLFHPAKARA
ncbi:FAD-dependent oxidoreductase [Microbacterium album]|uniref:FAD-dependent oxidoreductase n=1 Tax=Microbacterium album TaxID=2053191 RepID=A0A917IGD1_9MICO|nr:NAD(P)/FAD-dependent oxidoreductase [Microbacterium album]GGH47277.1 FAD-dependent oxidoreductase [Microbacterium album]